jgi:hypothetical protein
MRDHIRHLWRSRPHPLRAIWRWASEENKIKRFLAAAGWARTHPPGLEDAAATADRYQAKAEWLAKHRDPEPAVKPLIVTLDGKQVPRWIAKHLRAARAAGTWKGTVISGYRSPAYSEQLCLNMCGHPTCPGVCGGRNSYHACPPTGTGVAYEGAVDLTDPAGFQRYCRAHGNPLHGNGEMLPADTPHFSRNGH